MVWSGSTKTGYMYDETKTGKIKAEAKIQATTKVDGAYDIGVGLKFKSTSSEPNDGKYPSEKIKSSSNPLMSAVPLARFTSGRASSP